MDAIKRIADVLAAARSFHPPAAALAQAIMQPGGWKMEMQISARNPSTGESKTLNESVSRMCLTREFLARDPYLMPGLDHEKMERRIAKCSVSDQFPIGNSVSWRMACRTADGSAVEMSIRNTASASKLASEIQQTVRKDNETIHVRMMMDASHLGTCTNEMPEL